MASWVLSNLLCFSYLERVSCPEIDGDESQPNDTSRVHSEPDKFGLVEVLWNLQDEQTQMFYYKNILTAACCTTEWFSLSKFPSATNRCIFYTTCSKKVSPQNSEPHLYKAQMTWNKMVQRKRPYFMAPVTTASSRNPSLVGWISPNKKTYIENFWIKDIFPWRYVLNKSSDLSG